MTGITSTKISADDRNLFINAAKLAAQQRAAQNTEATPNTQEPGASQLANHPNKAMSPSIGAKIKVVGVGGGGTNAINTMISSGLDSVDFVAANTDTQSLSHSLSPVTIQVGKELTKGLGAGADPDIGRDATLEDRHEIMEALTGSDMVFVTAGMGGGTGTGGASVVAQIARELGALTVGVVTKPFTFEGRRRSKQAEIGIERLREAVDTLIVIPNQRLLQLATPEMSLLEAFRLADKVLLDAVRGISDIINIPGTINVDFADVKTIMSKMGRALMGIGFAEGEGQAMKAATMAISSPLLEDMNIEGATGVLINITAAPSVGIIELNEACSVIHESAHEDANIIMGTVIDENMKDGIRVTVIATGFAMDHDHHPMHTQHTQDNTLFAPPPKKILSNIRQEMSNFNHYPATQTAQPTPTRSSYSPQVQPTGAGTAINQSPAHHSTTTALPNPTNPPAHHNPASTQHQPTPNSTNPTGSHLAEPASLTQTHAQPPAASPLKAPPSTTRPSINSTSATGTTSAQSNSRTVQAVPTTPTPGVTHAYPPPKLTQPKGGMVGSLLHKQPTSPSQNPVQSTTSSTNPLLREDITADIENSIDDAIHRAEESTTTTKVPARNTPTQNSVDIEVPTFLRKPNHQAPASPSHPTAPNKP